MDTTGHTMRLLVVVSLMATICSGYTVPTRQHTVYYKGQYINTSGADEATSRNAHQTAQAVFRNFYSNLILRPEIEQLDLTILLDSSMSIGANNYLAAKYFLSMLIAMMPANNFRSRIRTSMYTFSESILLTKEFAFEDLKYRELTRRRILSSQFHNITYTHLTTALYWMDAKLQLSCRPAAKKVLIVATDGNSNDDSVLEDGRGLNGPVSDLNEHDVETYVVALSESIDLTKIAVIASPTDSEHIFHLKNYNATATVMEKLLSRMQTYYNNSRS